MAPMTRSMATDELVPTEATAEYYARRAAAGLLLTEATIVRADGQGYPNTPGIWNDEQVAGWSRVTRRVHEEGGRIFLQIWHVGRVSHPVYLDGGTPVAPSAVPLEGRVSRSEDLQYGTPRALRGDEIPAYIESFAEGARNARAAGFDGVEIHGANGYLIDQFLHFHTNRRTDAWGGTPAAMVRFAVDVVDSVVDAWGDAGRVGLRLSPGAYFNMEGDPRDAEVFRLLLGELSDRGLAYVHTGIFDDAMIFEELDGATAGAFLREHWNGTLIGCGNYQPETGAEAIEGGRFDALALGRSFLANPDLVAKTRVGDALRAYDASMLEDLV
ncbi:MAG: alkene reductase [Thermoanaerobaculia bacterium]|nr:alkene reductase [Thermoanaerobaculia bacterium]